MLAQENKIDLFISYSKHDESWARRLYNSLILRGIRPDQIFFDKEYLKPGATWEPIMSAAVTTARVLVCLWSNHAKESNYVVDERSKFEMTMVSDDDIQKLRRLIIIPLEQTKKPEDTDPYAKYQWADDILESGAYATGAQSIDPSIWDRLVNDIYIEVTRSSKFTPITLVAVAMTRDRIDSLNFDVALPNNDTLANAIKKMGIITDVSLLDRLDPTMRVSGSTLDQVLLALNVKTARTGTDEPREIHIKLPNGKTLGETLKDLGIMTVDHLLSWLKLHPAVPLPNGDTLDNVLSQKGVTLDDLEALMIKTALRQYYSDSPLNWRPFGSPTSDILSIMNQVQGQYNSRLSDQNSSEPPFRWETIEDFSLASPRAAVVRHKLSVERSVMVVDPLSLYEQTVQSDFQSLYQSFENEKALIMAFAPFVLPTPTSIMRELVKHQARRLWDYFFEPEFRSGKVYAKCGPDVGDSTDITRWLLHTLKPQFGAAKSSGKNHASVILSTGT